MISDGSMEGSVSTHPNVLLHILKDNFTILSDGP